MQSRSRCLILLLALVFLAGGAPIHPDDKTGDAGTPTNKPASKPEGKPEEKPEDKSKNKPTDKPAGKPVRKSEDQGDWAVGLVLFAPTGITVKYRMDESRAAEGALGGFGGRLHLHGVYQFRLMNLSESLDLYAGGGVVLQEQKRKQRIARGFSREDTYLAAGLRAPLGLSYFTTGGNIELFGELNLNMFFLAEASNSIGLAFGVRYYFE